MVIRASAIDSFGTVGCGSLIGKVVQEQLAELSGLSLRTIQRIEKRGKVSMESKKALAAGHELLFEAPDELLLELLARFGGN